MRRRYTGPSDEVKAIVLERDGYACALCGAPDDGFTGFDIHHRLPRGRGGDNRLSNLVLLCRFHHEWVESARELATEDGWLVPTGRTPSEWAIPHFRHGVVHLDDEGGVIPVGPDDEPSAA